jgi:hypothetical protein
MMTTGDAFIADVAKAVARLMAAVEVGEPHPIIGEVTALLNLLIDHRNAPATRPDDAALGRAVAALNRKEIAG